MAKTNYYLLNCQTVDDVFLNLVHSLAAYNREEALEDLEILISHIKDDNFPDVKELLNL
jgi:hypothetical protein